MTLFEINLLGTTYQNADLKNKDTHGVDDFLSFPGPGSIFLSPTDITGIYFRL